MDRAYEAFCLADPLFYESPTAARGDDVDFELARGPVPEGWRRAELDDWLVYARPGSPMPDQGWKIHVSACLDEAETILAITWDHCIPRGIPFKFIRSRQLLFVRNSKYAPRGSSGKFITIYPTDEEQLLAVLEELGDKLRGHRGPYILSDLRWGGGPLYVRYGGFAERYCVGEDGQQELALLNGEGELVPDRRDAVFHIPDWVELPEFLRPHLDARNRQTIADLPYTVERALHFSNGGGIYTGVDRRTGEPVLLKEARPHAGLSTDGADAVDRLRRERDILERLAGLDVAPRLRDSFTVGDHHFLVRDFVEGTELSSLLVERSPFMEPEFTEQVAADYAQWALEVHGQVEAAIALLHSRDVSLGDLHPSNVLVREDGGVVLIDFEVATLLSEGGRPSLANPSFVAPRHYIGADVDRHALACLRLFMFLPLTTLFALDPGKPADLADAIAGMFPVPREWLDDAVATISRADAGRNGHRRRRPAIEPTPRGWAAARKAMTAAILASATPERDDRLFPGDIAQFATGGLDLAYGAAGVLLALRDTGTPPDPLHVTWLVERSLRPKLGTRMGFYDGLHGVAYCLERLGQREEALRVLDVCMEELDGKYDRLSLDLAGGLAGIGLNLGHFADLTGDSSLRDRLDEVVHLTADRLGGVDDVPEVSGGAHPYAGLIRGSAGPALLFVRAYERTGDAAHLDLAATALRQDLRRCVMQSYGALEVDEGWRTMPYLCDGSVGIGMVLEDYLRHREDEELREAAATIRHAAESHFYVEPGVFYGRAGMLLYLCRSAGARPALRDPLIARHLRQLRWHALDLDGHIAFPGEMLLRISMDLASGTAGVLLAVAAALQDEPAHLPFLQPADASDHFEHPQPIAIAERR